MSPLLSVVIPFYNGEKFVDNIITAFLAQTCKDFELICVDDGSTDNTLKVLNSVKDKISDFKMSVIHQNNGGVSVARNNGLEYVTGDFISFVDCDDYVTPDYVELLLKNKDVDFDLLIFQQKRIHNSDAYIVDTTYEGISLEGNMGFMTDFVKNPTQYGVYNMFIKKVFYDKYKFKFREGFKYYEDYEFMYRIFCLAQNVYLTEHQVYFYILHAGSAMQSFNVDRLTCIQILEDLKPFIKENMPEYLAIYDTWCASRIYWSIMWQACIAFSYSEAMKFAKLIDIKTKVKSLKSVSQPKVKYSTYLLETCLPLYILFVKIYCRSRSAIKKKGNLAEFEKVINESIYSSSNL